MEKAVPVLPADDISAAKQFYVDKLGFQVTFEASDGKAGIMGVERGTMAITIDAPMSGHGRQACVSLHVDDADRYYDEWRAKVDIPRSAARRILGRADVQRARSVGQHDLRDRSEKIIPCA